MPIMAIPGMGFSLEESALKFYLKMRVDGMPAGGINSAYRSVAEQEALFLSRYARTNDPTYKGPFGDHRYWLGNGWFYRTSPAGPVAVPGTSTHTYGRALDMSTASTAHYWMVRNAPAYGWKRTLWDAWNLEPWHWEWAAHRVTINDTPEEDVQLDSEDLEAIRAIVREEAPGAVWLHPREDVGGVSHSTILKRVYTLMQSAPETVAEAVWTHAPTEDGPSAGRLVSHTRELALAIRGELASSSGTSDVAEVVALIEALAESLPGDVVTELKNRL